MTPKPRSVIWARLSSQGRGPTRTLDYATITSAAISIADEEGLGAVSMRAVAGRLARSPMSLYRHIGGKDDLSELMYDAVLGELNLTATPQEDWRAELTRLARSHRQLHHRHPWINQLGQRQTLGPNSIRRLEYAMACVDGLGLDIDKMLDFVSTTLQFTQGFVQGELAEAEAQRHTGMDRVGWHRHMTPFVLELLQEGKRPYFARLINDAEDFPDPDIVFERRLSMILDGLAARLETASNTPEINEKSSRIEPF